MASRRRFDDVRVGDRIPELAKVVKREDVKAYADASGDQNPLHQDDAFARSVGFPGIIAHGMFSMAHVVKALTDWAGDPRAVKRMKVQFRAVVYMDETLVAKGEVVSIDPQTRRARLNIWAEVERAGDRVLPIKNSEAEVELA
jgi:meromycolic acid (3R)-3-hydroxyacyl-[acyl-carrier protein] dehydratase HadB